MAAITPGDLISLYLRTVAGRRTGVARRVFQSADRRVLETWGTNETSVRSWQDVPLVVRRIRRLITGSEDIESCTYIANRYFDRRSLRGLSVGCGAGSREIRWAQTGAFASLLGVDVSPARIAEARQKATSAGVEDIVRFDVADVRSLEAEDVPYDVIIAEGILHHLTPLRESIARLRTLLRPDGYFVANEYVGPRRFQWSKRQLQAAREALRTIPEEYRTYIGTKVVKGRVFRPGTLSMRMYDPSEAVESDNVRSEIHAHFRVLEEKPYGGTILHPVLKDIAHHFVDGDGEARRILQALFAFEDDQMSRGLSSDFTYVVCQNAAGVRPGTDPLSR